VGSWTQKLLQVTVQLGANPGTNQPTTFAGTGSNTITFPYLRTSARVANSGATIDQRATVRIWGVQQSEMYQLSTLGLVYNIVPKNVLTLAAGDLVNGFSTVFSGSILSAYGDYQAQPDVPFVFECVAGLAAGVAPVAPATFQGSTDVATIISGFARQLGMGFQNAGVNVKLSNPYFPGTVMDQLKACAAHAGIEVSFGANTLTIFPRGGSMSSSGVNAPIISAQYGMIDYPVLTTQGIIVKTLFSPKIAFGGLVQVGSSLLSGTLNAISAQNPTFKPPQTTPAGNSIWSVFKLDHALDSQVPRGQWMSTAYCYNPGYPRPASQAP
jgi:hypothetical protein